MHHCDLNIYEQNETIFQQGEPSPCTFFLIRGTAKLTLTKKDMGGIPVVIKTIYDIDGQDFGEQAHLKAGGDITQEAIDKLSQ